MRGVWRKLGVAVAAIVLALAFVGAWMLPDFSARVLGWLVGVWTHVSGLVRGGAS